MPHRPRQQISTVVNYKPKGARQCSFQTFHHQFTADGDAIRISGHFAVSVSVQTNSCLHFYLRCKFRYFTGNTFSPHLFLTAFLHTNRHKFPFFPLYLIYPIHIISETNVDNGGANPMRNKEEELTGLNAYDNGMRNMNVATTLCTMGNTELPCPLKIGIDAKHETHHDASMLYPRR